MEEIVHVLQKILVGISIVSISVVLYKIYRKKRLR